MTDKSAKQMFLKCDNYFGTSDTQIIFGQSKRHSPMKQLWRSLTSNADCLKESPQIWDNFGPNQLFSMLWPPKDKLRSFPSWPKICFSKLFRYLFFVAAAHPLSVITITNGSQSRISYLDIAHPVVFSAQNSSCLTFYENLKWKIKLQFRYSFYFHTVAESN